MPRSRGPRLRAVVLARCSRRSSREVESGLFAPQAAIGGGRPRLRAGPAARPAPVARHDRHRRPRTAVSLAVDDAAWASTWRRRSRWDKLLLCGGLVVCALVLPAWPGSLLVGLTVRRAGARPGRVPARTFARAVRWPVGVRRRRRGHRRRLAGRRRPRAGRRTQQPAPDPWSATPSPAVPPCCCSPARRRCPTCCPRCSGCGCRRPSSRSRRSPTGCCSCCSTACGPSARRRPPAWGTPSLRRSLRSDGALAAAVLTRSWDRARRLQDGLAGRGMETGLRVLPEERPSSRRFVAATVAGLAALVAAGLVAA